MYQPQILEGKLTQVNKFKLVHVVEEGETDRQTNITEDITFPQTTYAYSKNDVVPAALRNS